MLTSQYFSLHEAMSAIEASHASPTPRLTDGLPSQHYATSNQYFRSLTLTCRASLQMMDPQMDSGMQTDDVTSLEDALDKAHFPPFLLLSVASSSISKALLICFLTLLSVGKTPFRSLGSPDSGHNGPSRRMRGTWLTLTLWHTSDHPLDSAEYYPCRRPYLE